MTDINKEQVVEYLSNLFSAVVRIHSVNLSKLNN